MGLFRTVGYGGDSGSIEDIAQLGPGAYRWQQYRRKPPGAGDARQAGAQAARAKTDRCRSARTRDGATAPTSTFVRDPVQTWSGSLR